MVSTGKYSGLHGEQTRQLIIPARISLESKVCSTSVMKQRAGDPKGIV